MSEDEFEDFEVENLFDKKSKRKKINVKKKGNRGELELCKLFSKRFHPYEFSRTIGSGNRWSQVRYVKKDFVSDIVTPDNFKFAIECKNGYDLDIHFILDRKNETFEKFLKQTVSAADQTGLAPLLCWKKSHYPWIAFLQTDRTFDKCFRYGDWTGVSLGQLFLLEDSFFLR